MAKKKPSENIESRKTFRMREREQEQQRILLIALGVVAALVVMILAFGYWRTQIAVLDETIATVNGTPLKVRDYQARARYDAQIIVSRIAQLQSAVQQINLQDPSLAPIAQQYQQQYAQLQTQLLQVPGQALENLIDDELVRQEAKKRGITVTSQEVDREIELQIKEGLGYARPTSTPTVGPSPTASSTPTATLTPTSTATPSVSPTATATLSATLTATPTQGPTSTPAPTQTPLGPEAYATQVGKLKDSLSKARYSFDDYRAIIEVQLLRQKLNDALGQAIPTTAEQVRARQILVKTFEEAQQVEARLKAGEDFGKLAQELSIDPTAKTNSGDLGWQPRGYFIKEFEDAAFSLPVMQISSPVTTTFGVHIIQVLEKDANRALSETALAEKRASALDDWLQQARTAAGNNIERFFSTDYVPGEIKRLQTPSAPQSQ